MPGGNRRAPIGGVRNAIKKEDHVADFLNDQGLNLIPRLD